MVAEIIDYNIVHVEIGDYVYEGVISDLVETLHVLR